jgi:hypothetical protein
MVDRTNIESASGQWLRWFFDMRLGAVVLALGSGGLYSPLPRLPPSPRLRKTGRRTGKVGQKSVKPGQTSRGRSLCVSGWKSAKASNRVQVSPSQSHQFFGVAGFAWTGCTRFNISKVVASGCASLRPRKIKKVWRNIQDSTFNAQHTMDCGMRADKLSRSEGRQASLGFVRP